MSKIHVQVLEFLKERGFKAESEVPGKFYAFNEYFKKQYSPIVDILIEEEKVVVEVNGDYWHGQPDKYKPTDLIYKFEGPVTVEEMWKRDAARKKQIESFGYKVIEIWESDITNNYFKEKLLNEIHYND